MTREEQLDWLCRLRSEIYVYMPKEWLIPMNDALDMSIKDLEQEPTPMVEIDLYSVIKQKYIEREVLDKIRAEIKEHADRLKDSLYGDGLRHAIEIIDKYKAESEEK